MYCNYCGKPLNPGEVCSCQQPQAPVNNYYGGFNYTEPATPAIATLRRHGSSKLMLVLAILFSVGTLFNIINAAITAQTTMDVLSYGYGYSDAYAAGATVGSIFGAIAGSSVNFLYIAAMFMLYKNCKSPVDGYIKTAGLTIFKVFSIISIVLYAILAVLMVILGIVFIALGSELAYELDYLLSDYGFGYMATEAIGLIFGIIFIILAIVIAVGMILQILFVKTLNSLKSTCTTGTPALKISRFFAVMTIIGAVGNFFSGLTGIWPFLTYGCLCTSMILGAVLLFKIRKDMYTLAMNSAPAYNGGYEPNYYNPVQPPYYTEPQQPVYTEPQPPVYNNYSEPQYTAPVEEETQVLNTPVYEEPEVELPEVPVMEVPKYEPEVLPELEVPAAEPTAEPVFRAAEDLIDEAEEALPTDVICENCGKSYSRASNFCIYCGTKNPNK